MKIAICITLAVLVFLLFQWEISGNHLDAREAKCRTVTTPIGFKLANDYEYYNCLGR